MNKAFQKIKKPWDFRGVMLNMDEDVMNSIQQYDYAKGMFVGIVSTLFAVGLDLDDALEIVKNESKAGGIKIPITIVPEPWQDKWVKI